jgi:hypothetical protein
MRHIRFGFSSVLLHGTVSHASCRMLLTDRIWPIAELIGDPQIGDIDLRYHDISASCQRYALVNDFSMCFSVAIINMYNPGSRSDINDVESSISPPTSSPEISAGSETSNSDLGKGP